MAEGGDRQSGNNTETDVVHLLQSNADELDYLLGKHPIHQRSDSLRYFPIKYVSDRNTINLRSRGQQDGIRQLLPLSAEVVNTFVKQDLQDARFGQEIYREQFRSSSDGNKIFQMRIFKGAMNGVQWLCVGIKDCSARDTQNSTLISFTCSIDGMNNKVCHSVFLRAGCGTKFGIKLCRVYDLPRLFTLRSSVWAAHLTVPRIITNQKEFEFSELSREQGRARACQFKVNWTLNNLGPRENFTRGESICSKPFGDVEEELVMVLVVYPNGYVSSPAGKWDMRINMIHLPEQVREKGLQMNYKISGYGGQWKDTDTFKEGQSWGFNTSSSNYNSRKLKIILEADLLILTEIW